MRNPSYVYKCLGQSYPDANTLTDIFTVPDGCTATLQAMSIANGTSSSDTYSWSVAIGGQEDEPWQYVHSNILIDANNSFIVSPGITLAPGDVVRVISQNGNCVFNLFGYITIP
jgi:hypothetical protein